MYLWLKLVHVIFATMVGIGSVGGLIIATRARAATSVREVRALMQAHHLAIVSQVVPGAIGSLVTGGVLVWMVGFDPTATWIAGAAVAWVVSLVVGVGLLVPAERRALAEADRQLAAAQDVPSPVLREAVGGGIVVLGEWTTVVLLVAMLALMVLKPS